MKALSAYEGGIFDLDGTLTDSMHVWDTLCRDWLKAQNRQPHAGLEDDIASMTLTQSAEYVKSRFEIPLKPEEIIAGWEGMALDQYEKTVPLKRGAAELVCRLARRGLRLAVATSCFPAACEAVLRRHRLRDYFSFIVYSGQVKRDKSYPDIWLACAQGLGLAPEKCLVFEDMYHALKGVRAAGMDLVAVYDDSNNQWEAMSAEADRAVRSLEELIESPV
jgi:HAD superfamily hydrolase (TIGR01509 family)